MVLFCGGKGLRLRGAVGSLPKPMIPIGGRPLLWHIMRYYAHFGHRDFVLCLGHQARVIEEGEDMPAILNRPIAAGELVTYPYDGFWAPMDTLKDKQRLEALVTSGGNVWQVWETAAAAAGS